MYWTKSYLSGEEIISVYSPDKRLKVISCDEWYGDGWDAKEYGRDFDFTRTFAEQFSGLVHDVPQPARSVFMNENSEYVNETSRVKNCYLIFEADYSEHCYYAEHIHHSRHCMDCTFAEGCELCYECIDCEGCYGLLWSKDCVNCSDSAFLENCIGCKNCFGSVNLRHQEYVFLNEQLTGEEYRGKIEAFRAAGYAGVLKMREEMSKRKTLLKVKPVHGTHNEDSLGSYVERMKNCQSCFDCRNCRDCKYLSYSWGCKDVYDMDVWGEDGAELLYEVQCGGAGTNRVVFSDQIWGGVSDILYSKMCCNGSTNLFGCVGLKHANHCVFNKQYTKEEYQALVPRIIEHMRKTGEWGEFLPAGMSLFGYNETVAQEYFPLTKEQALQKGFNWSDFVPPAPRVEKIVKAGELPNSISDVPDVVLDWAIECEISGKPFKIIKQELKFLREHGLPLPRRHPDVRHLNRIAVRNPRKFFDRKCVQCGQSVQSTYASDRPEKVFCEECYLKEVY